MQETRVARSHFVDIFLDSLLPQTVDGLQFGHCNQQVLWWTLAVLRADEPTSLDRLAHVVLDHATVGDYHISQPDIMLLTGDTTPNTNYKSDPDAAKRRLHSHYCNGRGNNAGFPEGQTCQDNVVRANPSQGISVAVD
jgi:hypothetical protein